MNDTLSAATAPRRHTAAVLAVLLAILAAAIMVGPVTAAPIEDYGSTYSCRYRTIEGTSPAMADLKRIVVAPPMMFADEDNQTLGWRIIIRRALGRDEDDAFKVTTWKSKIRTAVANQGQAADFSRIVYSPPDLSATSSWDYDTFGASLRLIWYAQDGSVQRTVIHEFWSRYDYVDGEIWSQYLDSYCAGKKQLEQVDGP